MRKEAENFIAKHGYSGYLHRDSDVISCQDDNVCFDFLCSWKWSKHEKDIEIEIYSCVKCMLGHPESCVMIPEEEIEAEKQYYETMIRKELLEDLFESNAIESTNNSLKYHDLGA